VEQGRASRALARDGGLYLCSGRRFPSYATADDGPVAYLASAC